MNLHKRWEVRTTWKVVLRCLQSKFVADEKEEECQIAVRCTFYYQHVVEGDFEKEHAFGVLYNF